MSEDQIMNVSDSPSNSKFDSDKKVDLPIELRLGNFKAFAAEQRIPIKPITLIFGANSAGKSSILQSMLLMKQSEDHKSINEIYFDGNLINLVNFKNVIHNHDISLPLTMYESYSACLQEKKVYRYDNELNRVICDVELVYEGETLFENNRLDAFAKAQKSPVFGLITY